jgi:hypothetical protein
VRLSELRDLCTFPLGDHIEYVRRQGERKWHSLSEKIGFLHHPDRAFKSFRYPFRTGLHDRDNFAPRPIFSRRWHIDFRQTFALFETRRNSQIKISDFFTYTPDLVNIPRGYGVGTPEAVIFAESQDTADEVLRHINAAMLLFNGYSPFERDAVFTLPDELSRLSYVYRSRDPHQGAQHVSSSGILSSCEFVARTWQDVNARLALARFYHATHVAYHHPLDASPSISDFNKFDLTPFDLMAIALSITSAYSAIEELRLDPRPKKDESVLSKGIWNSRIIEELQDRLRQRRIDPNETMPWLVRGRLRMIEKKVAPPQGMIASWARTGIGDRIVPLYEAILLSSRIRHRAAAHATKRETRALTPVDLLNVHSTSRHLLMAAAGLSANAWRREPAPSLQFRLHNAPR